MELWLAFGASYRNHSLKHALSSLENSETWLEMEFLHVHLRYGPIEVRLLGIVDAKKSTELQNPYSRMTPVGEKASVPGAWRN